MISCVPKANRHQPQVRPCVLEVFIHISLYTCRGEVLGPFLKCAQAQYTCTACGGPGVASAPGCEVPEPVDDFLFYCRVDLDDHQAVCGLPWPILGQHFTCSGKCGGRIFRSNHGSQRDIRVGRKRIGSETWQLTQARESRSDVVGTRLLTHVRAGSVVHGDGALSWKAICRERNLTFKKVIRGKIQFIKIINICSMPTLEQIWRQMKRYVPAILRSKDARRAAP